jgi:predicted nucleic acid-binding protein
VEVIGRPEVGNALTVAERRGRLTSAQASSALHLFRRLPIRLASPSREADFRQVVALARQHRMTTYDASYMELAQRAACRLATLDRKLAAVARKLGIESAT